MCGSKNVAVGYFQEQSEDTPASAAADVCPFCISTEELQSYIVDVK
jgi:hypothetical protein